MDEDQRDTSGPMPEPEIDALLLWRQRQRLLAEMFDVEAEHPTIEHYELLHEIGRGGMGVVYAAHDRKLDRKVAIKKLLIESDPLLRQRLVGEAMAMAKLAHPNVVPVHEIGELGDGAFIVMEYVEGLTLREWLAQAPRTPAEIVEVFLAAGRGLAAAHAKGIVHRDFKPDNVMVGEDGRARVMDFGVARSELADDAEASNEGPRPPGPLDRTVDSAGLSASMTRSGALVGTPAYMSPEQLRGRRADAASDQFAFAVALHEALYGARPFVAETLEGLRRAVCAGELSPPSAPAAPAWLWPILARALAAEAERRFGSMDALLEALASGGRERAAPSYVFVAHASRDKLAVLRLCEGLLAQGVRAWLDIWELLPGDDRGARTREAIAAAPAVLLCAGPQREPEPRDEALARALEDRVARDPSSVWRVELPGASTPSAGPVELERLSLSRERWDAELEALAARVGVSLDRSAWLADEARRASVEAEALSPYRGLEAFRERDARWMFGRGQEIGELVERFETSASRFLAVIGASGSGKSSLVMGGLCPALRAGVLGADRRWRIAALRPGPRPCEALARALVELRAEAPSAGLSEDLGEIARLRDALIADSGALRAELSSLLADPSEQALIVVDQLEELFTEAGLRPGRRSAEATMFLANLIIASRPSASASMSASISERSGADASSWIVATLRADFVHRCLEIGALARVLRAGTYFTLAPIGRQQIRAVIEQPARRVGYELDGALVDELVSAAAEQPGRLPLLQHVLRELWQRRDPEARELLVSVYAEIGGLEGAVAAAADAALARLIETHGAEAEVAVRRVMTRLVHPGEVALGDTRRRATGDELGTDALTRAVLAAFVTEARVLVASKIGLHEVFEIAHEALLREWTKLVAWLDADREALRLRQELAKDAASYAVHLDPEYLWGRGRVEEARRILADSTVELIDEERTFLARSHERARGRERLAWASVAGVIVVLLALLAFTADLARQNQQQASNNEALVVSEGLARERAADSVNAQKGLRASMLAEGRMDLEPLLLALEALGAYGPPFVRAPPPDSYRGVLDALAMRGIVGPVAALEGHRRDVVDLAFAPNGLALATAGFDGGVRLWDASSGEPLMNFAGHEAAVTALAFSPDGARLATASWDRSAQLWDVSSGERLARLEGHDDDVVAVSFSEDGTKLATASSDDTARLWDASSGEALAVLEGHGGNVRALAFSGDGARLATASDDGSARLWDAASGAQLRVFTGHQSRVLDVQFSPDGARLLSCGFEAVARLWDVSTGAQLARFEGHQSSVVRAVFSPDGATLATASFDDTARLWRADTGAALATLAGHTDDLVDLAFSPDGARLITGSKDGTARLWQVATGRELATLAGHQGRVTAVAVAVDGVHFATASADGGAKLWASSARAWRGRLEGHSSKVAALAFSPDSARLASAGYDASVRLWDPWTARQLAILHGHSSAVVALAFSPGGARLASAGHDASVRLWDPEAHTQLALLEGHGSAVVELAFSPDGAQLASASHDGSARLWDASSGEPLATLVGHRSRVVALAFSPSGTQLATASYDGSARLWDVESGIQLDVLDAHDAYVVALAFSPDGSTLASGSWDRSARLWGVASGTQLLAFDNGARALGLGFCPDGAGLVTASGSELRLWELGSGRLARTFTGHGDTVLDLALSPDGSTLASASADDSVRLWELGSGRELISLEARAGDQHTLGFSPDGAFLASAGDDGSVQLWPMAATALSLACRRAAPYLDEGRIAAICKT